MLKYLSIKSGDIMVIKEKIRAIKLEKTQEKYKGDYYKNTKQQALFKNFVIFLDNFTSFANTLDVKSGISLITLTGYMIHNGIVSEKGSYTYNDTDNDICTIVNKEEFNTGMKVFSGEACCRHTASFGKLILDNFNIKNYEVETYGNTIGLDENLLQILRFLNDIHHKSIGANRHNHMINYICENGLEFFADITYKNMALFYGNRGLAYNFNSIYSNAFPLYNYNCDGIKSFDFSKVPPLTKDQCLELDAIVNDNLSKFKMNHNLFLEFYLQNKEIYHNINEAYNGLYEEQKKLELIR